MPGSAGRILRSDRRRHRYDVQVPARGITARPAGLALESLDPFGALTRIDYDQHDLLPVTVTDAVGLTATARPRLPGAAAHGR